MDYTEAKRTFQALVNKEDNSDTQELLKETFYSWVKEHYPLEYQLHKIKQSPGIPEGATLVDSKSIILVEHRKAAFSTGFPRNKLKAFNLLTVSHPDWNRTYTEGSLEFPTDIIDKWEYPNEVSAYTQLILNYEANNSLTG